MRSTRQEAQSIRPMLFIFQSTFMFKVCFFLSHHFVIFILFWWRARTFRCHEIEYKYIVTVFGTVAIVARQRNLMALMRELCFWRPDYIVRFVSICAWNARRIVHQINFSDVYLFCWFAFFSLFSASTFSLPDKNAIFTRMLTQPKWNDSFFALSSSSFQFSLFSWHGFWLRPSPVDCVELKDQNKYFLFPWSSSVFVAHVSSTPNAYTNTKWILENPF